MAEMTYLARRLDELPTDLAVLVPTGRCPVCGYRVPVTRDRLTVKHRAAGGWNLLGVSRLSITLCCAGTYTLAGMIMVAARV